MFAVRVAFCAAFLASPGVSHGADSHKNAPSADAGEPAQGGGISCSAGAPFWAPPAATAAELPWHSVWLGHFSGGRPYIAAFGVILVDWLDDKVCFASRSECMAWVKTLRRSYHRPEGYWTCLLIR
jgi:hypothetical protein